MSTPFAGHGHWIADQRGGGRGLRLSCHVDGGYLVLSTWREDTCVSTVRLLPEQAAGLVAGLAEGLGQLAERSGTLQDPPVRAVS